MNCNFCILCSFCSFSLKLLKVSQSHLATRQWKWDIMGWDRALGCGNVRIIRMCWRTKSSFPRTIRCSGSKKFLWKMIWVPRKWKNNHHEDILTEDVYTGLRVEPRYIVQHLWLHFDVELMLLSLNHEILHAESCCRTCCHRDVAGVYQLLSASISFQLSSKQQVTSVTQCDSVWLSVTQCDSVCWQVTDSILPFYCPKTSLQQLIHGHIWANDIPPQSHHTSKSYVHFGSRSSFKSCVFDNCFQFGSDWQLSKEWNKRTPTNVIFKASTTVAATGAIGTSLFSYTGQCTEKQNQFSSWIIHSD